MEAQQDYTVRQFRPEDMPQYRAMRLEALRAEPGMFGNSHELEQSYTDGQWLERVSRKDGACFGLYAGHELIGITGIVTDASDPATAYMTQSYIRRAYRGRKLSRLLYEARFDWARAQRLRRLTIGHRAGNTVSKAANQHFGFRYTHREARQWPDGAVEDMLYYELEL